MASDYLPIVTGFILKEILNKKNIYNEKDTDNSPDVGDDNGCE